MFYDVSDSNSSLFSFTLLLLLISWSKIFETNSNRLLRIFLLTFDNFQVWTPRFFFFGKRVYDIILKWEECFQEIGKFYDIFWQSSKWFLSFWKYVSNLCLKLFFHKSSRKYFKKNLTYPISNQWISNFVENKKIHDQKFQILPQTNLLTESFDLQYPRNPTIFVIYPDSVWSNFANLYNKNFRIQTTS